MNKPNVGRAIETMVKYLVYLNISFILISLINHNSLSTLLCSLNLAFLLLRQGIKSKAKLIELTRL